MTRPLPGRGCRAGCPAGNEDSTCHGFGPHLQWPHQRSADPGLRPFSWHSGHRAPGTGPGARPRVWPWQGSMTGPGFLPFLPFQAQKPGAELMSPRREAGAGTSTSSEVRLGGVRVEAEPWPWRVGGDSAREKDPAAPHALLSRSSSTLSLCPPVTRGLGPQAEQPVCGPCSESPSTEKKGKGHRRPSRAGWTGGRSPLQVVSVILLISRTAELQG